MQNNDAALEILVRLYNAGDWTRANVVCRDILGRDAQQATALLISGEIALRRGNAKMGISYLQQAVAAPITNKSILTRVVQLLQGLGDLDALDTALKALVRIDPQNFNAYLLLGRVKEARGHVQEAVSAYEAASAILPGHAGPDTARALLLLRQTWGDPPPSNSEKRQRSRLSGHVAMTTLGQNGRFGNQLFQYCFLRIYGEIHNLRVEVPDWVGRWLFDLNDPYPGLPLPRLETTVPQIAAALDPDSAPTLSGHDLFGYGQCHTRHFRTHQARFRALLRPGVRVRGPVTRAFERLRSHGQTIVAIHLRRGDYTGGEFSWPAPSNWYIQWLEAVWDDLKNPVLYLASDDPNASTEFSSFTPIIAKDLNEKIPGAEMYLDFYILTQADLLAISNSTFSMAAAMLNENAREFVRPHPIERRLLSFDPWDADTMLAAPVAADLA